ncbi:MAG: D-alanyl-D-alanine carboxypeptidase [Acidobacteria bacterium]|nr:D-alanyl-D-alanine carboxypeptidase [Acidobacteriota bacterium]
MLKARLLRAAGVLVVLLGVSLSPVQGWAEAGQSSTSNKPAAKKSSYSRSAAQARRARMARARAAARERQLREAQTPRFRVDEQGNLVPDVRAEAAIIYNPDTGEILWEENAQNQRSIASITKVMTGLVFLEDTPDLNRHVTIDRHDVRGASVTYLRASEQVSLSDVLHLALIASDNAAARTLARYSSYGPTGFVRQMNERAAELGLESTEYHDPSGLDPNNVSSAYDMARLIAYAAADHRLASIMRTAEFDVRTNRRKMTIHNTNKLVGGDLDVRGGKTGFIAKAGYCLATLLGLPDLNLEVAVVVLGARSNAGRFWETRHLLNWLTERLKPASQ